MLNSYFKPPTPPQEENKGKKKPTTSKHFSDVVIPAGSLFEEIKPLNGVTVIEGVKVK